MSVSREQIPESVWRAREAEWAERSRAEDDDEHHLAALQPVGKVSQRDELIAILTTGSLGYCPVCGGWAEVADGIHICRICNQAWDAEDET